MAKDNTAIKLEPINRAKEIGYIRKLIYNILNNHPAFEVVLNWYGVPGIGKTTLGLMTGTLCNIMGIPFSRVDFDPGFNPNAKEYKNNNYPLLMEDILNGFKELKPEGFLQGLEKYRDKKELELFLDIIKNKPVVLVFDTTDKAASSLLRWIEENILSPLCISHNCLIIWTGRNPQGWKIFEVRRKVVCQQLEPLDIEATKQQVGEHGCRIYKLTHGHPYSNKTLANVLKQRKDIDENELLKILRSQVLDDYIMKGISPEVNESCRVLSVIRQFDINILERLLSKFVPDFINTLSGLGFIGRLTATSIVEWNSARKGYCINETLRYMLKQIMRNTEKESFIKITENALKIYEEWIPQVSENRGVYILEWLYHKANVIDVTDDEFMRKTLNQFEDYLKTYYQKGDNDKFVSVALNQLYEDLIHDKELEGVFGKQFEDVKNKLTPLIPLSFQREG